MAHDRTSVIQDAKGSPDFPNVDVKASKKSARNLSIRADALGRHPDWIVVGCQVQGYLVEVAGWLPYSVASFYPIEHGANGHSKPYVLVPYRDLNLFRVMAHG